MTARKILFDKQNGICFYCRNPTRYEKWTVDHLIPRSRGGHNHRENKVGACDTCNHRKSCLTVTEYVSCGRITKRGEFRIDSQKLKFLIKEIHNTILQSQKIT